jgi:hypothetical protein
MILSTFTLYCARDASGSTGFATLSIFCSIVAASISISALSMLERTSLWLSNADTNRIEPSKQMIVCGQIIPILLFNQTVSEVAKSVVEARAAPH